MYDSPPVLSLNSEKMRKFKYESHDMIIIVLFINWIFRFQFLAFVSQNLYNCYEIHHEGLLLLTSSVGKRIIL